MRDQIFNAGGYYRYKGIDGISGYRTGKLYRLFITPAKFNNGLGLNIQRKGWKRVFKGPGYYPYDTLRLFFRDWEIDMEQQLDTLTNHSMLDEMEKDNGC